MWIFISTHEDDDDDDVRDFAWCLCWLAEYDTEFLWMNIWQHFERERNENASKGMRQ